MALLRHDDADRLNVPAHSTTGISTKPIDTS